MGGVEIGVWGGDGKGVVPAEGPCSQGVGRVQDLFARDVTEKGFINASPQWERRGNSGTGTAPNFKGL